MISVFRKIRKQLFSDRKISKYLFYALGEILLVVIGILIALQVNNWNEERKNTSLETQYTERIYSDLKTTRDRLERDLNWQRKNVELGRLILGSFKECSFDFEKRDDIAKGLFNLGKFNSTLLVNATLEELKTSGQLVIFKNKSLVSELIKLQRSFDSSLAQIDIINGWAIDPVNIVQSRIIYLNLHEDSGSTQDIKWEDIEFDFDAACNDLEFKTAVSSLINYTHEMARRDRDLLESTDKLLWALESKINEAPINTD